ncbi:MAG: Acg family FMN-binding oxidoreductase [Micromonosporaceae bacterium]
MRGPLAHEPDIRRLISAAGAAPSIHNTQPWRFRIVGEDIIEVRGDADRMLWVADPRGRALHLSCGAALFNLRIAIRNQGRRPLVWMLPDPRHAPMLLASVHVTPGRPPTVTECELMQAIPARHTNRAPFADRPVPEPIRAELEGAATQERAALRMLTEPETAEVLELAYEADRELAADPVHLAELRQWLTDGPAGDGLPPQALGPRPDTEPAPVRDLWSGRADPWRPVDTFESRPQLAVLSTTSNEPPDWLRAGQALQRVLLTATWHGIAASLLYQPIERQEMRMEQHWWPWREEPQMIIRFGYGPPAAGAPRRPFTDILDGPEA